MSELAEVVLAYWCALGLVIHGVILFGLITSRMGYRDITKKQFVLILLVSGPFFIASMIAIGPLVLLYQYVFDKLGE